MELNIAINLSNKTVRKKLNYPEETNLQLDISHPKKEITVKRISINSLGVGHKNYTVKDGMLTLHIDDYFLGVLRAKHWHVSKESDDYIYRYIHRKVDGQYIDRDRIGFDKEFIPCFGCSNTYGIYLDTNQSWPAQLRTETNRPFINLGEAGVGIDVIANNMFKLYEKHPFTSALILFPNYQRKIVSVNTEYGTLKFPTNQDLHTIPFSILSEDRVRQAKEHELKNIVDDIENVYSKDMIQKIVLFCKDKKIDLHCSSWSPEVYNYIETLSGINLLPKFTPHPNDYQDKASDDMHPGPLEYQKFVGKIKDLV